MFFLAAVMWNITVSAQGHSGSATDTTGGHLRISLLTCGPGDEEIYEVFGHTAVRVIDSNDKTDIVFNYGMFEYGPDFEIKFMRGKLLYCVGVETFTDFVQEYVQAHRQVEEQVLQLNSQQKESIYAFLSWNAEPANKYYKYDFFYDNCSTRIRDIFNRPDVFGKEFQFGQTLPEGKGLTFRDIMNIYFFRDHWTRLGVNILLGSRIDVKMTNKDIMFLPDYLRNGVGGATVSGQKIASAPVVLLPGSQPDKAGANWALIFTVSLALLTILGLCVPGMQVLGRVMSSLVLLATGLLGCLILVMWFATDHQGCSNNFNILWALPTNIIMAVSSPKGKSRYAFIALILLGLSLLLHLFKVQVLVIELVPVLIALAFIFGTIYRKTLTKPVINA